MMIEGTDGQVAWMTLGWFCNVDVPSTMDHNERIVLLGCAQTLCVKPGSANVCYMITLGNKILTLRGK